MEAAASHRYHFPFPLLVVEELTVPLDHLVQDDLSLPLGLDLLTGLEVPFHFWVSAGAPNYSLPFSAEVLDSWDIVISDPPLESTWALPLH